MRFFDDYSRFLRTHFQHLTNKFRISLKCFILIQFIFLFISYSQAQEHPQQNLFGDQYDWINVGVNPHAQVRLINPNLENESFGYFRLPSIKQFLAHNYNSSVLKKLFGIGQKYQDQARKEFVPPETGRGLLLPNSEHSVYRDILIKGTGSVEKFTANNQLRFSNLGFDGYFEISESVRDMVTSEVLHVAGVLVSRGLAIIDHNEFIYRKGISSPLRIGNYVRAYRVQTRLSNLESLTPQDRKKVIDNAILQLQKIHNASRPMNYVEYYHYMLQKMSRNVAIYQAIGFTQDSLHFGQVTLAGEMTDLGVGQFTKPLQHGVINTKYPWFRFERQPILVQNMLYKTHSVKAEPQPIDLTAESDSAKNQKTLFSYIQSFDPESAEKIEKMNPVRMFWEAYNSYYSNFDINTFNEKVKPVLDKIYNWSPEINRPQIPEELRDSVKRDYQSQLSKYSLGLEREGRSGPTLQVTAIEKQKLFYAVLKKYKIEVATLIDTNDRSHWNFGPSDRLIHYKVKNTEKDLSWKPSNLDQFVKMNTPPHPLSMYLKPGNLKLEPGQKIIWVDEGGVSPFAIIRSQDEKNGKYVISYEVAKTGEIKDRIVTQDELMKLNDPEKSIEINDVISGTKMNLSARLKTQMDLLDKRIQSLQILQSDDESKIKEKQIASLNELISVAYTDYTVRLNEDERKTYDERLRRRLSGKENPLTLNWAMVSGCGNCMDQNLFTSALLSKIAKKQNLKYNAYIAQGPTGKHFFTIVTLIPSQDQYMLDSSYPGLRLISIRQMQVYSRFPVKNIIDQHKVDQRENKPMQCLKLFSAQAI